MLIQDNLQIGIYSRNVRRTASSKLESMLHVSGMRLLHAVIDFGQGKSSGVGMILCLSTTLRSTICAAGSLECDMRYENTVLLLYLIWCMKRNILSVYTKTFLASMHSQFLWPWLKLVGRSERIVMVR